MRETNRAETRTIVKRLSRRAAISGRLVLLCLLPVVAGLGCASAADTPFGDPNEGRINFEVANRGFQDATLHVVWPGRRVRLGSVSGTRTSNFRIPWERGLEIQVEIDLLAGPTQGPECVTLPIWAEPGDLIYLVITNQIMRDMECLPPGGPNRPG